MSDNEEPVHVLLRPWDQIYLETWKKFLCTTQGVVNALKLRNPTLDSILLASTVGTTVLERLTNIFGKQAAVKVWGILVEFGADGLRISTERRIVSEAQQLYDEEFMEHTKKSREEFIQWIHSEEVVARYQSQHYCAATNNSFHFVQDVCRFLGIDVPERVQQLLTITTAIHEVLLRLTQFPKTFMELVQRSAHKSGASFQRSWVPCSLKC